MSGANTLGAAFLPDEAKSPLVDTFDRVHDYLRLSLTDRCNFRCFYCMPEVMPQFKTPDSLMQTDEILQIAKIFTSLGINKIRLTGGEPLVRKEAAEIIQQLGTLPVELGITTNGFLTDRFIPVFKQAGLRKINISLDSLNSESFSAITQRDVFKRVRENIDLLLAENFDVKINMVVTEQNVNELADFVAFTKEDNLQVRFIEFMPFAGNQWQNQKVVTYRQMLEHLGRIYNYHKCTDSRHSTVKSYQVQGFAGTFGFITSVTAPFCEGCHRLRLSADGKLRNCLFTDEQTDLLAALRNERPLALLIRENVMRKKYQQAGKSLHTTSSNSMVHLGG